MSWIGLIALLAIMGLITWLLVTYVPMPQQFRGLIIIVSVIIAIVIVLNTFGIFGHMPNVSVPKLR